MKSLSVKVAGLFFALFAVVHLVRIVQDWIVQIGPNTIPMAASYVAAAVSAFLAYGLLKGEKKKE